MTATRILVDDDEPNLCELVAAHRRSRAGPALIHTVRGVGYALRLPSGDRA